MIAIDLSKQQALDADTKALQQINFTGNLEYTITRKISDTNSSEIAHNGKSLISIFQEFSSSINKIFILARRLDTRLSFYEV